MPSRFDTMPSQPSAQACLKMIGPAPAKCLLNASRRYTEHFERVLALLERHKAEILAVEPDQIEGAKHSGAVMLPVAYQVENRVAAFVNYDGLAVEDA